MNRKVTAVLTDVPYWLNKICRELAEINPSQYTFLAIELNGENEQLIYGNLVEFWAITEGKKDESILALDGASQQLFSWPN
ncbi:MAG: hypothetical protein ACO20H_10095 [Bacteriovoracaceae bacterium]